MNLLRIGLLGCGTVGSGVLRVLSENAREIEARTGTRIQVDRVLVRDPKKPRAVPVDPGLLTTDPREILEDPAIEIIIELIGGADQAKRLILEAIRKKKHVVTANKAVLATFGAEIFASAAKAGVDVLFEGAVAGGIPIIRTLRESMASDRIRAIVGIVNGTTNFILSSMAKHGRSFKEALTEAQALGFAEADPSADIDGHDAAQKLTILASLGFGVLLTDRDVDRVGISGIRAEDLSIASGYGYAVKLIASAERVGDRLALRVRPAWVSKSSLLAHVDGAFNAVLLSSEALGTSLFYGSGAGQMPTGSAVVSDLIDLARNIKSGAVTRIPYLATQPEALAPARLLALGDTQSAFFLQFTVNDRPGALALIAGELGQRQVSLRIVHQEIKEGVGSGPVPVLAITHPAKESDLLRALEVIDGLPHVREKSRWMHILEL